MTADFASRDELVARGVVQPITVPSIQAQTVLGATKGALRPASIKTRADKASEEARHEQFLLLCQESVIPVPKREFVFHPERNWRFDFAWKQDRIALEVEGRNHIRPKRFLQDLSKYNHAALLGWMVLRVTPKDLCTNDTIEMIRGALLNRIQSYREER